MKKLITILSLAVVSNFGFAQVYNSPESVEFDYANNRWFIANHSGHTILIKNCTTCGLLPFATGLSSGPHGLEIVNDTLYACDGGNLRAYNINTGTLVFNIAMGATFLNGITHDNSGNLYLTDYTTATSSIHRFNTSTRQHNVFVATPGTNPNGIIYDQPNNRCVYVLWAGAIKSVLLSDSTTSTLLTSTLTSIDGIAKDGTGNYYLSSWGGNKVTRYTNTFTAPTTVITGLNSPADIFYNVLTDTLAVPNSGSTLNNVQFYYFGSSIGIEEQNNSDFNFSTYQNFSKEYLEISFKNSDEKKSIIELYDITGNLIRSISDESKLNEKHSVMLPLSGVSSGMYFVKIMNGSHSKSSKVILQ